MDTSICVAYPEALRPLNCLYFINEAPETAWNGRTTNVHPWAFGPRLDPQELYITERHNFLQPLNKLPTTQTCMLIHNTSEVLNYLFDIL